jgi:uncharacterized protein (DUF58 family)
MAWRKLRSTAIWAGIVALLLSQRHGAWTLVILLLLLLPWLLYSAYVVAAKPERRQLQASKAAIWIAAVALIVSVHAVRHASARERANQLVQAVRNYAHVHGHCPPDLAAAGIAPESINHTLPRVWYRCEPGEVSLSYPSVEMPFTLDVYDFKKGVWTQVD